MSDYTLYGDSRSGNCYKAALLLTITGRDYAWVETRRWVKRVESVPGFLPMSEACQ